jgi:hypothetical protein
VRKIFTHTTIAAIVLSFAGPALAVDRVSPELRARYGKLSEQAEAAARTGGAQASIEAYESALLGFAHGYGRVHLRLGQLYQGLDRKPEAAAHFRDCMNDDRVDGLDRDIICKQGLSATTAAFEFDGLPSGGRVLVLRPNLFAGPVQSGVRLPQGEVEVMVEVPDHEPRRATLSLPREGSWQVVVGLPSLGGPLVPDGFVGADDGPLSGRAPVGPAGKSGKVGTWPAWAAAGTGLALIGAGVFLGTSSGTDLDDVRSDQRNGGCGNAFCAERLADAQNKATLGDALWISGAAVTAGAVALYLWLSD